mmetsp:Transcript_7865/g.19454  ORF Transcript_7865/g.19454 Transcript_7865/m.19454 type:complete len:213 (-) Transcript_7865:470-1108(-)
MIHLPAVPHRPPFGIQAPPIRVVKLPNAHAASRQSAEARRGQVEQICQHALQGVTFCTHQKELQRGVSGPLIAEQQHSGHLLSQDMISVVGRPELHSTRYFWPMFHLHGFREWEIFDKVGFIMVVHVKAAVAIEDQAAPRATHDEDITKHGKVCLAFIEKQRAPREIICGTTPTQRHLGSIWGSRRRQRNPCECCHFLDPRVRPVVHYRRRP